VDPGGVLQALGEIIRALEDLRIPYLVGGSLASSAYGIPRTTQDGDVVADLRPEHVQSVVEALSDRFYIDDERMADAIRRKASFNVIHLGTAAKVDIFVQRGDPWSLAEMSRRRPYAISEGLTFILGSPEDIVLEKLRWFRIGGGMSDRQWDDVLGVLKVQRGKLDLDYLKRWASDLGLGDLLDKALEDAGPTSP
jgi:hypothetical protein